MIKVVNVFEVGEKNLFFLAMIISIEIQIDRRLSGREILSGNKVDCWRIIIWVLVFIRMEEAVMVMVIVEVIIRGEEEDMVLRIEIRIVVIL